MEHALLEFATMISKTALSSWVTSTFWLWPTLETLHYIGMSILIGSLAIVDLRLLGFFKGLSIQATHKLIPWAIGGFTLNFTTGVLFYFGDPLRYTSNWSFRIKMMLVLLSGLNALWFYWMINPKMHSWDPNGGTPMLAKVIATISLCAWFGVILGGRLIPYVSTG